MISHIDNVSAVAMKIPGAEKAWKKVCISPQEGWEGYVMRVFELEPGGNTPEHTHPWPHINYFLQGEGTVYLDGKANEVKAGSFAYIPSGALHKMINRGEDVFRFICSVPEEGEG